jgi:hypothetical protein
LPYAFSWYLDSVAENWDALVLGDYDTVMPLVWLRKLGVKCLYQPYYCQQLGVFGKQLNKHTVGEFLKQTRQGYSYVNVNLNPAVNIVADDFKFIRKKNLLLNLDKEYPDLRKSYSENHSRNIKKADKAGVHFLEDTTWIQFREFYLRTVNRKQQNIKAKHEKIFKILTTTALRNGAGRIYSVMDKSGKLLAASLLLRHKSRLINIINSSSPEGKKMGASHYLFDRVIQKHSGEEIVLDFEGSSVVSIARFYEGFGAEEEIFYNYQSSIFNKLGNLPHPKPIILKQIW